MWSWQWAIKDAFLVFHLFCGKKVRGRYLVHNSVANFSVLECKLWNKIINFLVCQYGIKLKLEFKTKLYFIAMLLLCWQHYWHAEVGFSSADLHFSWWRLLLPLLVKNLPHLEQRKIGLFLILINEVRSNFSESLSILRLFEAK